MGRTAAAGPVSAGSGWIAVVNAGAARLPRTYRTPSRLAAARAAKLIIAASIR